MPEAARGGDAVALVLAGLLVFLEGVQRVTVPGGLERSVGAGNRAESAGHAGAGGHRSLDWRPEHNALTVALRGGACVRDEPVQGESLRVGEHRRAADLRGL